MGFNDLKYTLIFFIVFPVINLPASIRVNAKKTDGNRNDVIICLCLLGNSLERFPKAEASTSYFFGLSLRLNPSLIPRHFL